MKKLVFLITILAMIPFSLQAVLTKEMVINKVQTVCEEVKSAVKTQDVFDKIISGSHPYKDKNNAAFYVFIYDESVSIVAHPKKKLVGKSYKGKSDIRGRMFRDQIVEGALKKGKGWVQYTYMEPRRSGEQTKRTYYKLCQNKGSNFIVACGIYDR